MPIAGSALIHGFEDEMKTPRTIGSTPLHVDSADPMTKERLGRLARADCSSPSRLPQGLVPAVIWKRCPVLNLAT